MKITISVELPKVKFVNKRWLEDLARAQRTQVLPPLRALFKQTVTGWSAAKKPDFGWSQIRNSNEMIIAVYPKGPGADIWNLVSSGSPAHPIPARSGGLLRFQKGYRAATTPGQLMSRRAYRSNPVWTAKVVAHPGFEPRDFPQLIADAYREQFIDTMQESIATTARS